MIDKKKLISHLEKEIESSFMGANDRDKTIVWHCERLIKLINGGAFDEKFINRSTSHSHRDGIGKSKSDEVER